MVRPVGRQSRKNKVPQLSHAIYGREELAEHEKSSRPSRRETEGQDVVTDIERWLATRRQMNFLMN